MRPFAPDNGGNPRETSLNFCEGPGVLHADSRTRLVTPANALTLNLRMQRARLMDRRDRACVGILVFSPPSPAVTRSRPCRSVMALSHTFVGGSLGTIFKIVKSRKGLANSELASHRETQMGARPPLSDPNSRRFTGPAPRQRQTGFDPRRGDPCRAR
jgi:hypothetical protein